jgi:CheY-like chemotaxis protein
MVGYNILPIGFSSYEKSTIETFFRLAGRRAPHWALTSRSSEARVVLFNATSDQDIASFRSLVASWQKVIIVGSSDFGTGWPVLPRPIKLTAILSLLDDVAKFNFNEKLNTAVGSVTSPSGTVDVSIAGIAAPVITAQMSVPAVEIAEQLPAVTLSKVERLAASTPAAAFDKPSMTDVFASITTQVEAKTNAKPPPAFQDEPVAVKSDAAAQPAPIQMDEARSFVAASITADQVISASTARSNSVLGRVLLVDDSDIALKYMQNRLRHFSYECDMVRSGEEALAMVATHNYQFVFLDVMMAGLDGYQTCKAIKNNKARRGPAPVVVMLTSKGGTIDKIRGSMAGCDAYLTKPLNDKKLAAVLTKYDDSTVTERWEAIHPRQELVDTYAPRNR